MTATKVSRQGYSVELGSLAPGALAALKKDLTMVPRTGGQQSQPMGAAAVSYPLYRANDSKIYVPVNFGLARFGQPTKGWQLDDGEPMSDAARRSFAGELRPVQLEAVAAFLQATRGGAATGGILSLPCGFGKTICAIYAIAQLGRKALIVVHKLFLEAQWLERIGAFLPGASVGVLRADKVDVEGRDIVIASLQSLSLKTYDPSLFARFGTLVVDECHRIGTECFSQALRKVIFRHTLGLSATVQRKDGCTKAFTYSLGDVLHRVKRRADEVTVVQVRFFDPDDRYSREELVFGGKLNTSRMINNVTGWVPRTRALAECIVDALAREPGRKVLVLSDRKDHLAGIKAMVDACCPRLKAAGIDTQGPPPPCAQPGGQGGERAGAKGRGKRAGKKAQGAAAAAAAPRAESVCGFYVGGMKPDALEASAACKVVLATYAFASEGFDVAAMDTLVLASPKTDIEQSVGRILRQRASERERTPLIIDFVDDFSVFARQGDKRRLFYKRHGYRTVPSMSRAWDGAPGPEGPGGSESESEPASPSAEQNNPDPGALPLRGFAFVGDE